jgi:hypothetical protein
MPRKATPPSAAASPDTASGIEKRKLKRHIKRVPARFQVGSQVGTGHICNLSKEGMFLRADRLPKPGSEITVVIETGGPRGEKVEIQARVMWTTSELPNAKDVAPGFGVRVEDPGGPFRDFFESLLLS